MTARQWNYLLLWVAILLPAVLLFSGTGPVPAIAADEADGSAFFSETPDVMLEIDDPKEDFFDEFDSFEEFDDDAGETVFDPLSGYNRVMTRVNDRLYYWVMKPMARGYRAVIPLPSREGIGNFFRNLGFPIRMVNNLLQLKFKRAGTETARFVVNSTIGVAGLWDAATDLMDIPVYSEDFGQTLGHYGIGGGFHIVLPLLGPSNVRDVCGKAADWFLDPINYVEDSGARAAISAEDTVNEASLRLGQYEAITQDSLDLYIFLRDGYQNRRNKAIEE